MLIFVPKFKKNVNWKVRVNEIFFHLSLSNTGHVIATWKSLPIDFTYTYFYCCKAFRSSGCYTLYTYVYMVQPVNINDSYKQMNIIIHHCEKLKQSCFKHHLIHYVWFSALFLISLFHRYNRNSLIFEVNALTKLIS